MPAIATQRSGRSLLPTRSLRIPAPIRPTAPRNWDAATRIPAAVASQPWSAISHTRPKVASTYCGITSSADTRWMRTSVASPRYGFAGRPSASVARAGRDGLTMNTAQAAAPISTSTAATTSAAVMLPDAVTAGTTSAAAAAPSGCDICRIPIANPRRSAGNHPITTRPLAELAHAEPMPATTNAIPSAT